MLKTKNLLIKSYCLIFVFAVSSLSCSKCKNKTYPPVKFSEVDLEIIPYLGSETLVFCDSLNDCLTYKGEGRQLNNIHNYYSNDCTNDGNDFVSQIDECSFSDSIIKKQIELRIGFTGESYESLRKYFFISINLPIELHIGPSGGAYTFNNDSILPGQQVSFYKTMLIGKSLFTSVYILVSGTRPPEPEYVLLVYYTILDGIIAFKTNYGHLWVVKKT